MGMFHKELEQIIPTVLARVSYERRIVEVGSDDAAITNLVQVLQEGIQWTYTGKDVYESGHYSPFSTNFV
jgi:hypothetical protein